MTKLKIDKGIPMPERSIYPFDEMEIGDSILFASKREANRCYAYYRAWCKRNSFDKNVKVGTIVDGFRVWRIK